MNEQIDLQEREHRSTSVYDVNNLVSDENSYWGKRLRKFIKHNEQPFEKCKEALMNDAVAWGVFAALLMTVGAAALTLGRNNFLDVDDLYEHRGGVIFNYNMYSYAYVGFNTFAFSLSFNAVVIGTQQYAYFNNIPAEMVDKAIYANKQLPVVPFVYVAIVTQGFGIMSGINLLYYAEVYACGVIAFIALMTIFFSKYLERRSYKALGL